MKKGGFLPPALSYGLLGILAVTAALAALSALMDPADKDGAGGAPLPPGSADSSCLLDWPGYPLPKTTVLPDEDLACGDIDAYGRALNAACNASCAAGCILKGTGHTWNCTEGGADSSRPESVWLCPGSVADSCDPPPLSPCEVDDTYCDAKCDAKLVQRFWPTQILNYFGVPIGAASKWRVGDTVSIRGESFTISCIAKGADDGGEQTCGNDPASFDIVVVDKAPTKEFRAGTCVGKP